jgi:putative membrane protein (TIGR04086 family)
MRSVKVVRQKTETSSHTNLIVPVLRGFLVAAVISLIGVLVFALVIKAARMDESAIPAVNQGLKILSVLIGGFISVRDGAMGWIKGGLTGLVYGIVGLVVFAAFSGQSVLQLSSLTELLILCFGGAVGGVIGANLKKK